MDDKLGFNLYTMPTTYHRIVISEMGEQIIKRIRTRKKMSSLNLIIRLRYYRDQLLE